jgi:hypothetical protein
LKRTFYGQIECASFRTAWVGLSRWLGVEGGRSSRRAANGFTGWKGGIPDLPGL